MPSTRFELLGKQEVLIVDFASMRRWVDADECSSSATLISRGTHRIDGAAVDRFLDDAVRSSERSSLEY